MPTYRIDKIVVVPSPGGPDAVELVAYLTDVPTGDTRVVVTDVDQTDMVAADAVQVALGDAEADIDFSL